MRALKEWCVFVIFAVATIIVSKCLFSIFLNSGYVPFTQEYDHRMYMKHDNNNTNEFDVLINEISAHLSTIPLEMYDDGERIRYEHHEQNWNVCIFEGNKRLYEYSIAIENVKSIERIENVYNESLIGITYIKDENSYVFNIGEYYRVVVSDDGVIIN